MGDHALVHGRHWGEILEPPLSSIKSLAGSDVSCGSGSICSTLALHYETQLAATPAPNVVCPCQTSQRRGRGTTRRAAPSDKEGRRGLQQSSCMAAPAEKPHPCR